MNKPAIIIFLFTLLLSACSSNNSNSVKDDAPVIIPIEGADFDVIPSDKFLDASKLVFLETSDESTIGDMSSYYLANGEFYVYNSYNADLVKRFASDGRYLNDIGAIGKGPGEYTQSTDIEVGKDFVQIMEGSNIVRILRYTPEGEFLKVENAVFPTYSSSLSMHRKSGEYFFYTIYIDYKVVKLSNDFTDADSLLSCSGTNRLNIYSDALCSSPSGDLFLFENGYNIIWEWDDDKFVHRYSFDFGRYTLEPGENDEERMFKAIGDKGMWTIGWLVGNEHYLAFMALFQPPSVKSDDDVKIYHLVYDRESKRTLRISNGDIREEFRNTFAIDKNNNLYMVGSLAHLDDWAPWKSYVEKEGISVKIDDNPIIFKVDLDKLF